MFPFLFEPANLPFSIALVTMILVILLEIISISIGAGLSEFLDALAPDLDIDLPASSPSTLIQFLAWLRVGEVPILMLALVSLTAFGFSGLFLQGLIQLITGTLLPPLIAIIPSCFCALPIIRITGGFLKTYMPQDETWAVSEDSLIGRSAILLAGTATQGNPIQAKIRDEHQQTHYVMVEPKEPEETFTSGEVVSISGKNGAIFQAVRERSGNE